MSQLLYDWQRKTNHREKRERESEQTQTLILSFSFSVVVFAHACPLVPSSLLCSGSGSPFQSSPKMSAVIFIRLHIAGSCVKHFIFLFFSILCLLPKRLIPLGFFQPIRTHHQFAANTFLSLTQVFAAILT